MLTGLISFILTKLLYFSLHVENASSFKKPLSAEKEKEYFELMANGDEAARGKIIEHNLRLVAHIVKKYYSATNDQDDLISIGTIGLIKAVNTFSYDKNTRFATYAARCIENEVLMHFRNVKKTAGDVYINAPIDGDDEGNAITLMDVFSDEESIIDNIDVKMQAEKLYKFMKTALSDREKEVITMRYGLYGKRALTQREIAKKLDISRSYVSRIEKKALGKLREEFEKKEKIGCNSENNTVKSG